MGRVTRVVVNVVHCEIVYNYCVGEGSWWRRQYWISTWREWAKGEGRPGRQGRGGHNAMSQPITPEEIARLRTALRECTNPDAVFRVAARDRIVEAMPRLLDEIERLRRELHWVGELNNAAQDRHTAAVLEVKRLRAALAEVAGSGVELDDPRMRYVVVQIGRETWNALRGES